MTILTKPEIAAALTGLPVETIRGLMEGRLVAWPRSESNVSVEGLVAAGVSEKTARAILSSPAFVRDGQGGTNHD